jgi:hypothetical protein
MTTARSTGSRNRRHGSGFWVQCPHMPRFGLGCGRTFGIEKLCLDWEAKEDDFVRKVCPYRRAGLHVQTNYISNAIIRSLQASRPRELPEHIASERERRHEFWFKKFRLLPWKSWTPVRLVRVPPSLADKLAKESRLHGDLADSTHGRDVKIRYLEHETPLERRQAHAINARGIRLPTFSCHHFSNGIC